MRDAVRRWFGVGAMLGVPLAILGTLLVAVELDGRFFTPLSHLLVIALISACATTIALVAAVSTRRVAHPGLAHLSVGTAGVGILMMGHGLTTPGVLAEGFNPWVGRFPHLALPLFAVTVFLAGGRVDTRFGRWVARHSNIYVATAVAAMGLLALAAVVDPTLGQAPSWEAPLTDAASVATGFLALGVSVRHWRRWHLGDDRIQLALTFAAAMTVAAVTSLEFGRFQQLSWWGYHAYLLAGFGCAVYVVWSRARQYRQIENTLAGAFSDDTMAHITDGYPAALLQMVKAVELKDTYTHGHSQRTAQVATELGLRMGLPPERLRVVARSAHFDPDVVDAMLDLAADWGIGTDGEAGDAEVASQAAETCHQASDDSDLVGV